MQTKDISATKVFVSYETNVFHSIIVYNNYICNEPLQQLCIHT